MEDFNTWRGKTVVDANGDKVGSIGELYVDDETERPSWMTVKTGLFGTKESFVPISMARSENDTIVVETTADMIKNAPKHDVDEILSADEERDLYEYYQQRWDSDSSDEEDHRDDTQTEQINEADAAGTVGHDTSGPTTDDAMTRSEERLTVDKEQEVVGKARLRKYVVTEHQTVTVPVQREEVRLEREPITDANRDQAMDGPAISEEEHEVVLKAERPVVTKDAVPVERVRLGKQVVEDQQEVGADVRKEQIEIDNPDRDKS